MFLGLLVLLLLFVVVVGVMLRYCIKTSIYNTTYHIITNIT